MKAIETRYKGYRFRSRLEARWAVFFDSLGLKWEFEPEGYKVGTRQYLPDFLVESQVMIEVKPEITYRDRGDVPDWDRWARVARGVGLPLLVVFGPPSYPEPIKNSLFIQPWIAKVDIPLMCVSLGICRGCSGLGAEMGGDGGYVLWCREGCSKERAPVVSQEFADAVAASRSARFEFGESGAPAIEAPKPKRERTAEEIDLTRRMIQIDALITAYAKDKSSPPNFDALMDEKRAITERLSAIRGPVWIDSTRKR